MKSLRASHCSASFTKDKNSKTEKAKPYPLDLEPKSMQIQLAREEKEQKSGLLVEGGRQEAAT